MEGARLQKKKNVFQYGLFDIIRKVIEEVTAYDPLLLCLKGSTKGDEQ